MMHNCNQSLNAITHKLALTLRIRLGIESALELELGQTRVQISLNGRIRCKTDMVVKAEDVWKWNSPKKTVRCNYSGSRCLAGGDCLGCCFMTTWYGVVTSHVTKMAVTPLDPPWPKPPVIRKLHGSVFYTPEVIAD